MRCVGTSAAWECVELTTLHAMPFEAASTPRPSAVVANRVVAACHRERRAGRTPLRLSPSGDPSVLAPLTRSRAQNARHAPVALSPALPSFILALRTLPAPTPDPHPSSKHEPQTHAQPCAHPARHTWTDTAMCLFPRYSRNKVISAATSQLKYYTSC